VFNTAPPLRHPSILDGIRRWYRNWSAAREGAFELQCAGAAEVGRIAQELGLSSFELRALVSHPDDRKLLAKRMAGFVWNRKPSSVRDPQPTCPKPREYRRFSDAGHVRDRDRTGWLRTQSVSSRSPPCEQGD
jgi:hypothetical protein